jgi:hypothetical protein
LLGSERGWIWSSMGGSSGCGDGRVVVAIVECEVVLLILLNN